MEGREVEANCLVNLDRTFKKHEGGGQKKKTHPTVRSPTQLDDAAVMPGRARVLTNTL